MSIRLIGCHPPMGSGTVIAVGALVTLIVLLALGSWSDGMQLGAALAYSIATPFLRHARNYGLRGLRLEGR